jgi:hypothetical protein
MEQQRASRVGRNGTAKVARMGMVDPDGEPLCEEKGNSVARPHCADTTPSRMIVIIINVLQQIYEIQVCDSQIQG